MKLIIDARSLQMYPVGQPGFSGGTEVMVRQLAAGLARSHEVHVVTPDLSEEEQRSERQWWWPPSNFPRSADAVILVHKIEYAMDYAADFLIFATNGVDPDLGPEHAYATAVDAFPLFSAKHGELLRKFRPTIPEDKCFVTGLGVDLEDYEPGWADYDKGLIATRASMKVPGRIFWANDPARGLWHMLDIFDKLKPLVPEATLHVGYDFKRQHEYYRWAANAMAEVLWECKARLEATEGVTDVGALTREEVIREQLECQVHVMASDPPNVGSQIHGMFQMECAAAGAALVLSDTEAFPEVFGGAALILPLPGVFLPTSERRYDAQDWADATAELILDSERLKAHQQRSRQLAEQHTWTRVIDRWQGLLDSLVLGKETEQLQLTAS